jgi:hypothetical protein
MALDEDKVSHLKLFVWGRSFLPFLVGLYFVPGLKECGSEVRK